MTEKENVVPLMRSDASVAMRHLHLGETKGDPHASRIALAKSGPNGGTAYAKVNPASSAVVGTPVGAARVKALLGGQVQTSARTPLGAIQPGTSVRTPLASIHQTTRERDAVASSIATPSSASRALRERMLAVNQASVKTSQTPRSGHQGAARSRSTWNGDVDAYAESVLGGQNARPRQRASAFAERVQRVKDDSSSAEHWWDLLSTEEEELRTAHAGAANFKTLSQNLYKLYEWATKLVPRKGNKNNESYVGLWLGYIKRQKNEEDIRDTFKTLRNMGIGETSTALYKEWALFEVAAGNVEKAKGIVKKGVKAGAVHKSEVGTFLSRLSAQPTDPQPQPETAPAVASGLGTRTVARMDYKLSGPHRPVGHLGQAAKQLGEEDDTMNGTDPSVLSSRTFCSTSGNYTGTSSTLHTSTTPFRTEVSAAASSAAKNVQAYSTPTGTSNAHSVSSIDTRFALRESKHQEAFATPSGTFDSRGMKPQQNQQDLGTPGKLSDQTMKGPKRLGLKRFSGPARRIKPTSSGGGGGEDPAKQQVSGGGGLAQTSVEAERGHITPMVQTQASMVTENYTDLSGKLSPIVEVSYSTHSSSVSRNSTRTASSSQTEENASRKASPGAPSQPQQQERPAPVPVTDKAPIKHHPAASNSKPEASVQRQQRASVSQPAAAEGRPHAQVRAAASQQVRESSNSVTVHNVKYTVLECVGKGGSSKVYKVISPEHKIFALKRIKLEGREKEAAAGFMDEITLLKRFTGRHHIIQLVDSQIFRDSGIIYMILEYGEVDLARLLQKRERARRDAEGQSSSKIDLNFIRLHWQQMLEAVHIIHEERIVHSDLKPANFLFVEGVLKLIDFGIAKAIQNDTTHIARESQVGTLNYMSPEAILSGSNGSRTGKQTKVGRASDVWSLGCILYQMVYGRTPFSHLHFIQKLHAITDPNHQIEFPPIQNHTLLDVMKRCLDRNPKTRIGIPDLLDHVFLNPSQENVVAPSALLTPEFLNSMLLQLSSGGQTSADISKLSQELCKQLAAGTVPDLKSLISSAGAGSSAEAKAPPTAPPPPPPPPMPPAFAPQNKMKMIMADIKKKRDLRPTSQAPRGAGESKANTGGTNGNGLAGTIAAAAAAKALARSKQRQEAVIALENREISVNNDLKDTLQKQHAALRPVGSGKENSDDGEKCESGCSEGNQSSGESLAGVFRHELNKKFQNAMQNNDTVTVTGDLTGSVTEDTMDMSWN